MSTTTQARTTKSNAKATATSAKKTVKSASRKASTTTKRETRRAVTGSSKGVTTHTRRVLGAFQAEANAVASQPTRPLFFTLGVVDRATAGVRALPSTLISTPARTRNRVVSVAATAGDLAERAQRGYTEVAKDGEKLVAAVRRQDSTQRAVTMADRAQTRAASSVKAAEQAIEAGTEAAVEAVSKLG